MALRFRRSVKIAPGLRMNFGKRGISMSAGVRGASMTFGSRGIYGNVGLPGTGLSYRTRMDGGGGRASRQSASNVQYETVDIKLSFDEKGYVVAQDSHGNELPKKYVKIAREQNPDQVNTWIDNECRKLNDDVESILNIHIQTLPLDSFVTFQGEAYSEEEPLQPEMIRETFWAKIFPFIKRRVESKNAKLRATHERDLGEWKKNKAEFDKEQDAIRHKFEVGRFEKIEVMEEFLEDVLRDVGWPRETIVDFDIQKEGCKVLVDLDLPEIEDLPNTTASIAQSGMKLNFKKRSEVQLRKDYMIHVHGIGFRAIGTIFAALPKAAEVVLSTYSQRANKATGEVSDEYLYSVKVQRDDWQKINFDNIEMIDVVECLSSFDIVRSMTKTGVFKAITPFDA